MKEQIKYSVVYYQMSGIKARRICQKTFLDEQEAILFASELVAYGWDKTEVYKGVKKTASFMCPFYESFLKQEIAA